MTAEPTRDATRGFFLLLVAAFLFLAGFVFLIIGVGTPSPPRVILAVALLAAGFLLMRSGYAAWKQTSRQTKDPGPEPEPGAKQGAVSGQESGPQGETRQGRQADESKRGDRMDR